MSERKKYKVITAVIRTIDCKTEKVSLEQIKIIDGPERREWLKETVAKQVLWAMFNGHYVEVINKEDDKEEE